MKDGSGYAAVCANPVRLYREDGRRRMTVPCGRRVCPTCGPSVWRPRVLAKLHLGLREGTGSDFLALLLTAPGDAAAWDFNSEASDHWHHFWTLVAREYPGLAYWRVAELQARGHVHFHVVVRGAQYLYVCRKPRGGGRGWIASLGRGRPCCDSRRCVRRMAVAAGFGGFVGLRRPRDYPGGVHSLGFYFGKYLLKSFAGAGGVVKLVTTSLSWASAWVARRREPGGLGWLYVGGGAGAWRALVAPDRRRRGSRAPDVHSLAAVFEWEPSYTRADYLRDHPAEGQRSRAGA